jgi:lysophospholipase L1-like esterase
MKSMKQTSINKLLFIIAFMCYGAFLFAQDTKPPYYDDIEAFKKQDSLNPPPTNAILFIGSSSFTNWTDVQHYFPRRNIINRAFGGSTLLDVTRYAEDVIFKYQPKQIVIYCGENDLAYDSSLYPAQAAQRFFDLFNLIRSRMKKVPVLYVSMKPSPARQNLMAKYNVANVMIREFLAGKRKAVFVDVYHHMLKPNGTPMNEIFGDDSLHMNARGYSIWQKLLQPFLIK